MLLIRLVFILRRILNIIIVFQHPFKTHINVCKRYFLNESFSVDNRDKTLIIIKKSIIIVSKKRERPIKRVKIDFFFSQPFFFQINRSSFS